MYDIAEGWVRVRTPPPPGGILTRFGGSECLLAGSDSDPSTSNVVKYKILLL